MIAAQAPYTNYDDVLAGQGTKFFYGPKPDIDSDGQSEVRYPIQEHLTQSDRDEDALVVTAAGTALSYIGWHLSFTRTFRVAALFSIFVTAASL